MKKIYLLLMASLMLSACTQSNEAPSTESFTPFTASEKDDLMNELAFLQEDEEYQTGEFGPWNFTDASFASNEDGKSEWTIRFTNERGEGSFSFASEHQPLKPFGAGGVILTEGWFFDFYEALEDWKEMQSSS